MDQATLTRIIRLSIARRVFAEPRLGGVEHSSASNLNVHYRLLLRRQLMGANVDDLWLAAANTVGVLVK